MSAVEPLFLRVLGEQAGLLDPELRAQLREGARPGGADGVFDVAGSRLRLLSALARPFVGPGLIITRFQRDVPFSMQEIPERTPTGEQSLVTRREFRFAGGSQRVVDRIVATGRPGELRSALGERGRIEVLMLCSVTPEGRLRMRSYRVLVRLGPARVPLAGSLGVRVDVEDGWDEALQCRTIDMRARSPLLGVVLEYRGRYRRTAAASRDFQ